MSIIRIDSQAVAAAASAASASIATLQNDVQNLHAHLTSLESSWQGPAATAFQGVVTAWHNTQQKVETDLQSLAEALGRVAQHYAELETATLRAFSL